MTKTIQQMTKRELIKEYKEYYSLIHNEGVLSVKQILYFNELESEILNRRYTIYQKVQVY